MSKKEKPALEYYPSDPTIELKDQIKELECVLDSSLVNLRSLEEENDRLKLENIKLSEQGSAAQEKKLHVLTQAIEERDEMDYFLSTHQIAEVKELKAKIKKQKLEIKALKGKPKYALKNVELSRKIEELVKEKDELRTKNANQASRNHDLHEEIEAATEKIILLEAKYEILEKSHALILEDNRLIKGDLKELNIKDEARVGQVNKLQEENEALREIVADCKKIRSDFILKDSKDVDSDSAGWSAQLSEWIKPIKLETGDKIKCLKDYFAEIEVGDVVELQSVLGNNYLFILKNGDRTWLRKDNVTTESFEKVHGTNLLLECGDMVEALKNNGGIEKGEKLILLYVRPITLTHHFEDCLGELVKVDKHYMTGYWFKKVN